MTTLIRRIALVAATAATALIAVTALVAATLVAPPIGAAHAAVAAPLAAGPIAAGPIAAGPAAAAPGQAERAPSPAGFDLVAQLVGAEEVAPAIGDPDGIGFLLLDVMPRQGRLCWVLWTMGIDQIKDVHLHLGRRGQAGPVAVPLSAPSGGSGTGCTRVEPATLWQMVRSPRAHYTNVHTVARPDGAIRGQLRSGD